MEYLKGVHTINLYSTNVTDEGMKYLSGVFAINIGNTKVTNEGVNYLSSTGSKLSLFYRN